MRWDEMESDEMGWNEMGLRCHEVKCDGGTSQRFKILKSYAAEELGKREDKTR